MPPASLSRSTRAFTLIELMVVVAVIALLATMATAGFIRARTTSQANVCISNLRAIDDAKQLWATDTKSATTATPAIAALSTYFRDGRMPVCPGGGTYNIRTVNQKPTCTLRATKGHKY